MIRYAWTQKATLGLFSDKHRLLWHFLVVVWTDSSLRNLSWRPLVHFFLFEVKFWNTVNWNWTSKTSHLIGSQNNATTLCWPHAANVVICVSLGFSFITFIFQVEIKMKDIRRRKKEKQRKWDAAGENNVSSEKANVWRCTVSLQDFGEIWNKHTASWWQLWKTKGKSPNNTQARQWNV